MATDVGRAPDDAQTGERSAPVAKRLLGRSGRRMGWGLADQAVSSLTNFAMSIYVARTLGAAQFGAFSLAYVTYSFALNASRGLATDPLLVRFSGTDASSWRRAVRKCTGTAADVGLATGAIALAVAFLLSGTSRLAFVALGLTLPGLLLQDSWRYSFFAQGRGNQAFLNDLVWAAALVPALLAVRITRHETVFWFVLAWGASAAVAALAGPLQARLLPRLSGAHDWLSTNYDLGLRYLGENTSNSGAAQLRTYAVSGIVGLAAVGYVQAATMLMGPFMVVFMGIGAVTVPEASRVLRHSARHLQLFCLLVGGGLALADLAWGAALLVLLPRGLGHWTLGSMWRPTYALILTCTLSMVGPCITAGATAGLHALGMAKRSLRAMILASAAFLVGSVAGAFAGGALGAMRGTAIATAFGALIWWWQLRAGLRESGLVAASGRSWLGRAQPRHGKPAPARGPSRGLRETPAPNSSSRDLADNDLGQWLGQ